MAEHQKTYALWTENGVKDRFKLCERIPNLGTACVMAILKKNWRDGIGSYSDFMKVATGTYSLYAPKHPDLNKGAADAIDEARQNFMDVPEDAADKFKLWLVEPRNGGNSPLYDLAMDYLQELEDGQ